MANFALPLTLSAVLVSALTYGAAVGPAPSSGNEDAKMNTVTLNDHKVWELKNPHSDTVCLLYKTRRVSSATSEVDIDPACEDVFSDSAFVSVWQEDELGNVSLADDAGNVLAEFINGKESGLVSVAGGSDSLQLAPNS